MTAVRDQVAVAEMDNMADLVLSQGGTTIANLVRYQCKVGNDAHRCLSPLRAQRCSNLVPAYVLPPATEDFDTVNATMNLVVQAVRKVDLPSWLPFRELSSWSDHAEHIMAIRGRLQGFPDANTKDFGLRGRPLRTGYSCAWRRSRRQAPPATSRAFSTASWCTGTFRQ